MSLHTCLLIERPGGGWTVVAENETQILPDNLSASDLAMQVYDVTQRAGLRQVRCLVAPASTSCFFTTVQLRDGVDLSDRAAMTYELEDHLPIDAEAMVAGFIQLPLSNEAAEETVAALAVEVDRWRGIADALEMQGITVRSIVPAAVLAARTISEASNSKETIHCIIVDDGQCDLVTISHRAIVDWKHERLDRDRLLRHQKVEAVQWDRAVVVGASDAELAVVESVCGDVEEISESIDTLVGRGARAVLANPSQQWFDLRRDGLAPDDPLRAIQTPLRMLTVAAVVCLVTIIGASWWRTQRIETEIADLRTQQQDLFRKAFPDSRIPGALVRRVRSEHAKFMASRGASQPIDIPTSAPLVLRELLAALPADTRFRVINIEILNGEVDLELEVRSPVDAGTLATSLSSAGFDVKPPVTTQKDAKTFDSILEADWDGGSAGPSQRRVSLRVTLPAEVTG